MRKHAKILLVIVTCLIIPMSAFTIPREIHVEWDFQYAGDVAGFRLYHENKLACQTDDPNATSLDCSVDLPDGEALFTMKSYITDGTESEPSQPYSYIFSTGLKAKIVADVQKGESPLPVAFDAATSTGDIVLYDWMFGDGETGTGSLTNHTYIASGNYTTTLKVTDHLNATDSEIASIVVTEPQTTNTQPSAVISSSSSVGTAPLSIEFDATASTDEGGSILTYEWDFGDGGKASGAVVNHTYHEAGKYDAKLTVTDNGGLTDTNSTPVLVGQPTEESNKAPTAVITASINKGHAPLSVSFDGGKSFDEDGNVVSYTWNFGDGTSSTGSDVTHIFSEPAEYTVTLKVKDDNGTDSITSKHTITVLVRSEQDDTITEKPKDTIVQPVNLVPIIHLLLNSSSNTDIIKEE